MRGSFQILQVNWPRWTQALPGYTVGSLGAFWTIQRVAILFSGFRNENYSTRTTRGATHVSIHALSCFGRRPRLHIPLRARRESFVTGFRHPSLGSITYLRWLQCGSLGRTTRRTGDLDSSRCISHGDGFWWNARFNGGCLCRGSNTCKKPLRPSCWERWCCLKAATPLAIFHGHAHGTELPPGESGMLYSMGFVIATGCLHAVGIGIGVVHRWVWGQRLLRFAGAGVMLGGAFFMWRAFA